MEDHKKAYLNKEKAVERKKAERAEKERIKLIESWVADDARVEWEDLEKLIDKYEIKIFSKTLERFRDNTIEELRKRVGYVNSDSFLVKGSGVFALDPTVYYKKVRSILKHNDGY